ncbi:hypothetical protein JOC34_000501 [Virgibacillus halotolerans]|uniref:hypothetical protein n=1 Tax=Virgibacillus halotolerans TaxID=1071053 RepID=UPI00195FD982|nr:hypothetical protein [Virgibacillus halotolerans]MBM7598144.1 hypothetical protein [Virgibacillus halotolerans]
MECKVCGHKHNIISYDHYEVSHANTEEFIHIQGHFTIDWGNGYNNSQREVSLYACPECNTVQMEV